MSDKHCDAYREEAYELLTELESSLLELEETPDDAELISRVFRSMHTIKGSGAMFGFDDIAAFTHEVETVFDRVRNGEISVTKELIDVTLLARDHIRAMLDASDSGDVVDEAESRTIIATLKKLAPASSGSEERAEDLSTAAPESRPTAEASDSQATYRIRFRPVQEIFTQGTNPLLLLDELRQLGDCRIVAHTDRIPMLQEIEPEGCYTYWDVILSSRFGMDAVRDVFIFVEDECELTIEVIDDGGSLDAASHKLLGDILVERGDLASEDLQKVLAEQKQKRIGEMLVEARLVDTTQVESAVVEQEQVRKARDERQKKDVASTIRVDSSKLDKLVDLVGELVTVQARLNETASCRHDQELTEIAEEVERLTCELRDNTMSVRMVAIGTTFSKFRRLVRDLSLELGKEIELSTHGAETELDKTVIERLNDPLVHLIRNCIDHGVEAPELREAAGKPRQGMVHLSATHSGAYVMIEITDDGAGLDPERIREKGISNGLISADADLTEKELFALLFVPGFSTAQQVTSISGRGVGMDVVKRSIDTLRGSIDIKSEKGIGTTISLKLPLTLAIIEGLLVGIGGDYFVLPLSLVEECVELTQEDVKNAHGRHLANVRGEIVPYIRLREQFHITGQPPELQQIVIAAVDDQRVGFVVDHVIGGHQTVIKALGRVYKNVEGVSGATILGDGSVALILDVPQLVQKVKQVEEGAHI